MILPTLVISVLIAGGIIFLINPTFYDGVIKDTDTFSYNNTSEIIQDHINDTTSTLSTTTSTLNDIALQSDYDYTFTPAIGNVYYVGADGHRITLIHNSKAVNPTYAQMVDFICQDTTNEHQYLPGSYTCGDFAETVQNNAENAGYKCAWVTIDLQEGEGHACNAFNTTDRGVVFVDCTGGGVCNSDAIVDIKDSYPYTPKPISGSSNIIYSSKGTVKDYIIFWDNNLRLSHSQPN